MAVASRGSQLGRMEALKQLFVRENQEDYEKWKSELAQLYQMFDEVEAAFQEKLAKPKPKRKSSLSTE